MPADETGAEEQQQPAAGRGRPLVADVVKQQATNAAGTAAQQAGAKAAPQTAQAAAAGVASAAGRPAAGIVVRAGLPAVVKAWKILGPAGCCLGCGCSVLLQFLMLLFTILIPIGIVFGLGELITQTVKAAAETAQDIGRGIVDFIRDVLP